LKIGAFSVVSPEAKLSENGQLGDFSILEANLSLGSHVVIGSYVQVCAYTSIGNNVSIFNGAIVGSIPQDKKYEGEPSTLEIGQGTTIREYATINRGTQASGCTHIGSHVLIMAYAHIAHDCHIADHVVIANAVQMGGHVQIGTGANIGGGSLIHQFVKIGAYAMVSGGSLVRQDVPPYITVAHEPLRYVCVNKTGLQRAGFSQAVIKNIEYAYALIFEESRPRKEVLTELSKSTSPEIRHIVAFFENSTRGIVKGTSKN
jgi:UDP-N-acetylglucosamine acyltransferase